MTDKKFTGKLQICYTDKADFTDYQGVGDDPMYIRFDSVFSIVKKAVPQQYWHFLATPNYNHINGQIDWYIDNCIDTPRKFVELKGDKKYKYQSIKDETIRVYRDSASKLRGSDLQIFANVIKYIADDMIFCADDRVFLVAWGMTLNKNRHSVVGSVVHLYDYGKKYNIKFDAQEHGTINSNSSKTLTRAEDYELEDKDIPKLEVNKGWIFTGWTPEPIGQKVDKDLFFQANYTPEIHTITFDEGDGGTISESQNNLSKPTDYVITEDDVPQITPKEGKRFIGWNINPIGHLVNDNIVFTAEYEDIPQEEEDQETENIQEEPPVFPEPEQPEIQEDQDIEPEEPSEMQEDKTPWYKRFWLWFTGKGCLKWLLWIILGILLLILLGWLLCSYVGCSDKHQENGVVPQETIKQPNGDVRDDNGYVKPITGDDGQLPDDNNITAPIVNEDGNMPPIIKQPGAPDIIANRLLLFLENENDNVDALAKNFKKAYSGDKYSIIGYDREVKLLAIQIPENERSQIRETINNKIPNHKFFVFDEEIYEIEGGYNKATNPGWHLQAIHLQQGWQITKGSSDIKIAIVDDGIQATHPMFKGRIIEAYNVFTQNNHLSLGDGHGTHVAGLAAGSIDYYSKGASGVAPNAKIMPIQVFDNKRCPLSALISGIMYAVHHDADVVNISIGPDFPEWKQLPEEQQEQIAHTKFKNMEHLWNRVCFLAAKKNSILVFAAGNDAILASIPPENRNQSAIVVTAVDKNLCQTDFTNYGEGADISAPGKDILSSCPTSTFISWDGTSMAAPIITGAIALMKSIKKDLTVTQARNVLYRTGADVKGNIPPMLLLDKALQGVKSGDFSAPPKRKMTPNPNEQDDRVSDNGGIGDDLADNPNVGSPNNPDYDAIRQLIEEYKRKIRDLEALLPKK